MAFCWLSAASSDSHPTWPAMATRIRDGSLCQWRRCLKSYLSIGLGHVQRPRTTGALAPLHSINWTLGGSVSGLPSLLRLLGIGEELSVTNVAFRGILGSREYWEHLRAHPHLKEPAITIAITGTNVLVPGSFVRLNPGREGMAVGVVPGLVRPSVSVTRPDTYSIFLGVPGANVLPVLPGLLHFSFIELAQLGPSLQTRGTSLAECHYRLYDSTLLHPRGPILCKFHRGPWHFSPRADAIRGMDRSLRPMAQPPHPTGEGVAWTSGATMARFYRPSDTAATPARRTTSAEPQNQTSRVVVILSKQRAGRRAPLAS